MNRRLLMSSSVFILWICLPYLVALIKDSPEYSWSGILFNPLDGNSYLAKMQIGYHGSWRFTLPYTALPGEGAFLFLFYIFLGHLARIIGLSIPLLYHLARVASALVLLLVLWRFFHTLFSDTKVAWRAFLLSCFGSGLGWLVVLIGMSGNLPVDFWIAEAYPFLSSLANPHFPLGIALMLSVILESYQNPPGIFNVVKLFMFSALLAVIMPFGVIVSLLVLCVRIFSVAILEKKKGNILALVPVILGGLPMVGYQYWATINDPVLKVWNAQNLTPSPPIGDFLFGFLPAILLAALAGYSFVRRGQDRQILWMGLWFIAGLLLIYIPYSLQRRFMFAYFLPVAGLAAWCLSRVIREKWVWNVTLLVSIPSNMIVIFLMIFGIISQDRMLYLKQEEVAALEWISNNTELQDVILSSPELGLFIPAQTGRRVVYGHPFETANADVEKTGVESFYSGLNSGKEIESFLQTHKVGYIIYGWREAELGTAAAPAGCEVVFEDGDLEICRWKNEQ